MDLKKRLRNKTFVVTMATAVVAFGYQALSICGVAPKVNQDAVTQGIMLAANVLAGLGILVNPTTAGITD